MAWALWQLLKRVTGRWLGPLIDLGLRCTARRTGVALLYHAIGDRDGDPRRDLVPAISKDRFRAQLRYLRRHYRVVPLDSFLDAVANRRRWERFPVCVTFDDDLAEHVDNALPLLGQHETKATFFLCGAGLDRPAEAWWQTLQRAWNAGDRAPKLRATLPVTARPRVEDDADIHSIAAAVEGLEPVDRDATTTALAKFAPPADPPAGLDRAGVERLAASGMPIGFHTRRHDALPALDEAGLRRAMTEGRADLEAAAGRRLEWIAYPHGYGDARVAAAAREAGFSLGLTAERRPVTPETDPLLLGRCDAAGFGPSLGAFALGIARTCFREAR